MGGRKRKARGKEGEGAGRLYNETPSQTPIFHEEGTVQSFMRKGL